MRKQLRMAGLVATGVMLLVAGGVTVSAGAAGEPAYPTASSAADWLVYHGDPAGDGVAAGVSSVDTDTRAWTSPQLDGELYGQPVTYAGRVYVATENDTVYALSAATGVVLWSTHLAAAVPSSDLPCGDITPKVGITGTPVIDPARNEIFVVADELTGGNAAHMFVGLNITTGAREVSQDVDPAGAVPTALLQRTGLTLAGGRVVFGMGGNDGDCASYRGRVIAVPEAGGPADTFTIDSVGNDSQGAVWMGGAAPTVDSAGQVLVAVGNGSVYSADGGYDDSDSALTLSSTMTLQSYFAPSDWPQNNSHDLDMSVAPALLTDGKVLLAGKSRIAYLLGSPAALGGIGGQQADLGSLCNQDIDGGVAVDGTTVYLPCTTGPVAVSANGATLHLLWSSGIGGGPPVLAGGLVWTIGQNGTLYGLSSAGGQVRKQASIGQLANHFPTPGFGAGLMLVPAATDVVAFSTRTPTSPVSSAGQSGPATSAPSTRAPGVPGSPTARKTSARPSPTPTRSAASSPTALPGTSHSDTTSAAHHHTAGFLGVGLAATALLLAAVGAGGLVLRRRRRAP